MKRIFITGGAGFIGSNLVRYLVKEEKYEVLNYDLLTYAGRLQSLSDLTNIASYSFIQGNILDSVRLMEAVTSFQPDAIMHLAAESHVDRSITGPSEFVQTNIVGTSQLLDVSLSYWRSLSGPRRDGFRYLHVSTDEVFGSLGDTGMFSENSQYRPNSPYSASKAAADHLARAWHKTYGLPVIISNCSNNYGPYQYPEKLIPVVILAALENRPIPIYGDGKNVRDWLYVTDHAKALLSMIKKGEPGEVYCVGGGTELSNLQIVETICSIMDRLLPRETSYSELITFVKDRPGHDFRYAVNPEKIKRDLGWEPEFHFKDALEETISWYLFNRDWWRAILG